MTSLSTFHSHAPSMTQSRSMGIKLIVVCGLALRYEHLLRCLLKVWSTERTSRESEVVREVSAHVGGQQTFLGPTVAIPYSLPEQSEVRPPEARRLFDLYRKRRCRRLLKPQLKSGAVRSSRYPCLRADSRNLMQRSI